MPSGAWHSFILSVHEQAAAPAKPIPAEPKAAEALPATEEQSLSDALSGATISESKPIKAVNGATDKEGPAKPEGILKADPAATAKGPVAAPAAPSIPPAAPAQPQGAYCSVVSKLGASVCFCIC